LVVEHDKKEMMMEIRIILMDFRASCRKEFGGEVIAQRSIQFLEGLRGRCWRMFEWEEKSKPEIPKTERPYNAHTLRGGQNSGILEISGASEFNLKKMLM